MILLQYRCYIDLNNLINGSKIRCFTDIYSLFYVNQDCSSMSVAGKWELYFITRCCAYIGE